MKDTAVMEVPRHVLGKASPDEIVSIELHGFADASNLAYGATIYLRVASCSGISMQLLASKTRVALLKKETIPQIELLGALILAKLMKSVQSSLDGILKINDVVCWVDYQIVSWWIKGKGNHCKQFVQNCLVQIR